MIILQSQPETSFWSFVAVRKLSHVVDFGAELSPRLNVLGTKPLPSSDWCSSKEILCDRIFSLN